MSLNDYIFIYRLDDTFQKVYDLHLIIEYEQNI